MYIKLLPFNFSSWLIQVLLRKGHITERQTHAHARTYSRDTRGFGWIRQFQYNSLKFQIFQGIFPGFVFVLYLMHWQKIFLNQADCIPGWFRVWYYPRNLHISGEKISVIATRVQDFWLTVQRLESKMQCLWVPGLVAPVSRFLPSFVV